MVAAKISWEDFPQEVQILVMAIVAKADEIERAAGIRPIYIAVHPETFGITIDMVAGFRVITSTMLERGIAYLLLPEGHVMAGIRFDLKVQ